MRGRKEGEKKEKRGTYQKGFIEKGGSRSPRSHIDMNHIFNRNSITLDGMMIDNSCFSKEYKRIKRREREERMKKKRGKTFELFSGDVI